MKSSISQRKKTALGLLESQLSIGTKPVKGKKPQAINEDGTPKFLTLKDGTKKSVLLDVIPLSPNDIKRKQNEITSLKRKLKIA